ncbi:MAG: isochorismatase family protein [Desulfobacteraceae bacterium]|nr:isochorismatase family protein [Desulfobacteraceae bacterium]MCB9494249.1 isochorismatase family protein [Desulfobacteraceae bacterium]
MTNKLNLKNSALVVTDVQEKLFNSMFEKVELKNNLIKLIKGFEILKIPAVFLEQNPKGLGNTIPEIKDLGFMPEKFEKMTFGIKGHEKFFSHIDKMKIKNIFICGIEAHVCVMQCTRDLIRNGLGVHLVSDCVSSRRKKDLKTGIKRMIYENAVISSCETALFEILETCERKEFKQILELVK